MTSPPPAKRPRLDAPLPPAHQMPHDIILEVLSHVPFDELNWNDFKTLRTVSPQFRDVVDRNLFKHITIRDDDTNDGVTLRSALNEMPLPGIGSWPLQPADRRCILKPHSGQLAKYTRVLDLYGRYPSALYAATRELRQHLGGRELDLLRMCTASWEQHPAPVSARKVVLCTRSETVDLMFAIWNVEVAKFIFALHHIMDDCIYPEAAPECLEELVVELRASSQFIEIDYSEGDTLCALWGLKELVAKEEDIKLTVVGLEAFPSTLFGMEGPVTNAQIYLHFVDALCLEYPSLLRSDIEARVRFVSHEERRAELGDEEYELEMLARSRVR